MRFTSNECIPLYQSAKIKELKIKWKGSMESCTAQAAKVLVGWCVETRVKMLGYWMCQINCQIRLYMIKTKEV